MATWQAGQPHQKTSERGRNLMGRDCSTYGYRQQLLMVLRKKKTTKPTPRFFKLLSRDSSIFPLKNKNILFVSFPSHCQEPRGVRDSWGWVWHLVTALLAKQRLPLILGSTFRLVWMEIRSHIPEGNQGVEMEAETECHAPPQRLPVGNNKPCTGPYKKKSLNSTFYRISKHFSRRKAHKISEHKILQDHQDPNNHSLPSSYCVKRWLNFSCFFTVQLVRKTLRQLCF